MFNLIKENKMFRVLLIYQIFSGLGGAIFQFFMLLAVHLMYENPIYTGITGFLIAFPHVFAFLVGPMVDRAKKPRIMRITTFVEFAMLALLAFSPLLEIFGVIFVFIVVASFSVMALFEAPTSTALLPQIVEPEKILKANSAIDISQLVGGLIVAVILFSSLGYDANFTLIFGVSVAFLFIAFLTSLFVKEPGKEKSEAKPRKNYLLELKEGAKLIKNGVLLYATLAGIVMIFFAEIAFINRPMFLEYHVGAQGYIIFTVVGIIGSIVASVIMGSIGGKFRAGRMISFLLILASINRIAFTFIIPHSLAGAIATTVFYVAAAGAVGMIFRTLRQALPPKDMVGRVETIHTTLAAGFVAVGAIAGGFIGSALSNVGYTFVLHGAVYALVAITLLFIPAVQKLPKMSEIKKSNDEE